MKRRLFIAGGAALIALAIPAVAHATVMVQTPMGMQPAGPTTVIDMMTTYVPVTSNISGIGPVQWMDEQTTIPDFNLSGAIDDSACASTPFESVYLVAYYGQPLADGTYAARTIAIGLRGPVTPDGNGLLSPGSGTLDGVRMVGYNDWLLYDTDLGNDPTAADLVIHSANLALTCDVPGATSPAPFQGSYTQTLAEVGLPTYEPIASVVGDPWFTYRSSFRAETHLSLETKSGKLLRARRSLGWLATGAHSTKFMCGTLRGSVYVHVRGIAEDGAAQKSPVRKVRC
jgi:hypothetical protein